MARDAEKPLDQPVTWMDGSTVGVHIYRGLPLLVVNTASEGPFADQYGALQLLYERFAPMGLEVLAFPSDDFGNEPREGARLVRTVSRRYKLGFPLCRKVRVRGAEADPLWAHLSTSGPERTRGPVTHDFTKFVIDPDGYLVDRLGPEVGPLDPRLIGLLTSALPTIT